MSETALARRLPELGRIRIGDQVEIEEGNNKGKPRPNKLDSFRITGNNPIMLKDIAALYGGEVARWERPEKWRNLSYVHEPIHEFELYTTSSYLDVIVPTQTSISTWREIWDAGGCAHRCDPVTRAILLDDVESMVGQVCERESCQEVTRFSVMLSEIRALGVWRLDTKGFYAASEIRGFFDIMAACRLPFGLEATLTLEERQTKSHKKGMLKFAVPVLQPKCTPRELLQMAAQAHASSVLVSEAAESPGLAINHSALLSGGDEAEQSRMRAVQPSVTAVLTAPEPDESGRFSMPKRQGEGLVHETSVKLAPQGDALEAAIRERETLVSLPSVLKAELRTHVSQAADTCGAMHADLMKGLKHLAPNVTLKGRKDLDTLIALLPQAVTLWEEAQPKSEPDEEDIAPPVLTLDTWLNEQAHTHGGTGDDVESWLKDNDPDDLFGQAARLDPWAELPECLDRLDVLLKGMPIDVSAEAEHTAT